MPKPKPKFQIGDVVRYPVDRMLITEFVEDYGRGPFIVSEDLSDEQVRCITMDGGGMPNRGGHLWAHTKDRLVLDQFLTAIHRAVKSKPEQNGHPQSRQMHREN